MDEGRIEKLNGAQERRGSFVLYWMQASQRACENFALEFALREARRLKLACVVCFGLTGSYPGANLRHCRFMLEGLAETKERLAARGIGFVLRLGEPDEVALSLSRKAALAVVDCGYTRIQRRWRRRAARAMECPLFEVESEAVVPVKIASQKEEYAAATIRPKISRLLPRFLVPAGEMKPFAGSLDTGFRSESLRDIDSLIAKLSLEEGVAPVEGAKGGTGEARRKLKRFIEEGLARYDEDRSDPSKAGGSNLSAHLHFGQISPVEVALAVKKRGGRGSASFLDELVVRRELAMNFCFYNPRYDSTACLPEWAKKTLAAHVKDRRPHLYSFKQLEAGATHDPIWNAAQREMVLTGRMHGYMRMYWGKKILEWSPAPEAAMRAAIRLNDRFELDGRDPNGYAGVAWCLGKHDRPWGERAVFGMVRYMNDAGLRRKFDIDAYLDRVRSLDRAR